MLVLQPEVVPDEAPEHLQRGQKRHDDLPVDVAHLDEAHRERPAEPQDQVLGNGEVVEPLEVGRGKVLKRMEHLICHICLCW